MANRLQQILEQINSSGLLNSIGSSPRQTGFTQPGVPSDIEALNQTIYGRQPMMGDMSYPQPGQDMSQMLGNLDQYSDANMINPDYQEPMRSYGQDMLVGDTKPGITQADVDKMKVTTKEGETDTEEPKSMYDKFSDYLSDDENRLNLALAFNSMRYKPDSTLSTIIGKQLDKVEGRKERNATYKKISKMDTPRAKKALEYMDAGGTGKKALEMAFGGADYGLTPHKITDEKGNVKLVQISKSGEVREVDLPEGYKPAPELTKVDVGNGYQFLNSDGQVVNFIPKNIEEAKAAEAAGKIKGEDRANAYKSYNKASASIRLIDDFLKHPGFDSLFGMIQGRLPTVRQETLDAEAYLQQIKGQNFLNAFETLKGGGQITELEGKKAELAMARLRETQSESAARQALAELKDVLNKAIQKAMNDDPTLAKQIEQGAVESSTSNFDMQYDPQTGQFTKVK